jgi:hypothetical protein
MIFLLCGTDLCKASYVQVVGHRIIRSLFPTPAKRRE